MSKHAKLYLLQTVAGFMPLAVTNALPQILSGTAAIMAVFLAAPKNRNKNHLNSIHEWFLKH